MRSFSLLAASVTLLLAGEPLVLDAPQCAGLSMFRAHWDAPLPLAADALTQISDDVVKDRGGAALWQPGKPGALAFDALNRSLLIRFPDAAEKIAARLQGGEVVAKVELVLPFRDEELWPPGAPDAVVADGYNARRNWGCSEMYRQIRPQWHAVAWALRRPWTADAASGPTYNAAVAGAVYWTKYGAQDEKSDRFATRFGPTEVSYKAPEGRMDLTAIVADPAFGATLAARLRTLADCGVLVQKEEQWDHRYYQGAYEWCTGTGPRAIVVKQPQLVVTFAAGKADLGGALPPPVDVAALPKQGGPTAVMPDRAALLALDKQRSVKPAWMPDWQWTRVQELIRMESAERVGEPFWFQFAPDYIIGRVAGGKAKQAEWGFRAPPEGVYGAWVDQLIGRPVRGWGGFESARAMSEWYLYGDTLPGPAQDAIRRYWTAWLVPDRITAPLTRMRDPTHLDGTLVHPMVEDPRVGGVPVPEPLKGQHDNYWTKTGDWRGNKSFFRSGFTYVMSTQNFNTTASAGALLGGAMIGSERAMADGRNGVEQWLMRQWAWKNGSGQEHLDHYYFAVTLSGNKAIADFAQTPVDRLMGQSLLAKQVEELISAWHPATRSLIAGSSRTHLEYLLGTQDGLQFILHTLSGRFGTVRDVGRQAKDMPLEMAPIGHELTPAMVARQTVVGPWAPEWVSAMVDDKPLPYYAVHSAGDGGWRKAFLGRNFGLASAELSDGRIQAMAQWTRDGMGAKRCEDLATIDLRTGINETRWANDAGGWIAKYGSQSMFQHKNRLLNLTSPRVYVGGFHGGGFRDDIRSVQSSLAVFDYRTPRSWELWVDGAKVEQLPFTCKQGSRILIKDARTFVAIVPLPATDCTRDVEVRISEGAEQQMQLNGKPYGAKARAALVIDSFWFRRDTPLTREGGDKAIWEQLAGAAGGFAVELADEADERGGFAAFSKRHAEAKLEIGFDAATSTASAIWTVDGSAMEAASRTLIPADDAKPGELKESGAANLVRRLLDGKDPSPPQDITRDTPFVQEGYGRVAKNGAVLTAEPTRRIYLLTEPSAGVICGWNPLPDLTAGWRLTGSGEQTVTANGRIGICRVTLRNGRVDIEHAFKPGQEREGGAATAFLLSGLRQVPACTLNGVPVVPLANDNGWTISLGKP